MSHHNHNHTHAQPAFDPRSVMWKDLVGYKRFETIRELCLPLPFLLAVVVVGEYAVAASGWAYWGLLAVMGVAVIYVFMVGLRVAHNAFHGTLGLSRRGDNWIMLVISLMMLGSSHAINYTHLYHHQHCMQKGDVEGELAKLPFWQALYKSPLYPFYIHIVALRDAPIAQKRWIWTELVLSLLVQCGGLIWIESSTMMFYSLVMLMANVAAPMVGIWAVHRHCEDSPVNARTCRSPLVSWFTCGMFYHAEHHLFPAVPTRHLAALAERIDATGVKLLEVTDFMERPI